MTKIEPQLASQIKAEIDKAKRILLHCHVNPDADSIGSVTAMYQVLRSLGKDVTAIKGDSVIPQAFRGIPCFDKILPKNIFEIDINDFDLFIILDSGALDRVSNIKPVQLPKALTTIVIDHHDSTENFGTINWLNTKASSTCEMVYELISAWGMEIAPDLAKSLFMGMYTDTGGFKYEKTTARTLEIASKLVAVAPDYYQMIFTMENSRKSAELIFQGLAFSNISVACDGILAVSKIPYDSLLKHDIKMEDTSAGNIANTLKSVEGWDIGACIIETKPNTIKMSFRTRDSGMYDLSNITGELGGGGHKAAAAVVMKDTSLEEAYNRVVKVVSEYINALK